MVGIGNWRGRVAAGLAVGLLLGCGASGQPAAAQTVGGQAAGPVEVIQYTDAVSVVIPRLDQLRLRHRELRAELQLSGGEPLAAVDLHAAYLTPALVLAKAKPGPYEAVRVRLLGSGKVLFEQRITLPPVVAEQPLAPLSEVSAPLELAYPDAARPFRQPALDRATEVALAPATRTLDLATSRIQTVADVNYPLVSANNNGLFSRQTAHPTDASARSMYVPVKSQLYDAAGKPTKVVHYLIEVPVDPLWAVGEGDLEVKLKPEDIKVWLPDATWPAGDPNGTLITGQGAGGLGQASGVATVDADGNLYYAGTANVLSRFNVAKAKWEVPPLDLSAEMNKYLPTRDQVPAELKQKITWDWYVYAVAGGDRIFLLPSRYDVGGELWLAGIFSIPRAGWDNPEAFRQGIKFHAGSWPGAPNAMYDAWPQPGQKSGRLHGPYFQGDTLYVSTYPGFPGGSWLLTVGPDGETKEFKRAAGDDYGKRMRPAQLALNAAPQTNAGGMLDWGTLGRLEVSRAGLRYLLQGGDRPKPGDGPLVTVAYNALAAMQRDPQRYALVLDGLKGPSLAPSYVALEVPDQPGHVLGVGEYGYFLARFNVGDPAQKTVRKEYLKAAGATDQDLPLGPGLGPYGYVWRREGHETVLYFAGYTGISRIVYARDGQPLAAHPREDLTAITRAAPDGANPHGTKWLTHPVAGLDNWLLMTGHGEEARGGSPYSGGLIGVRPGPEPKGVQLSALSRGYFHRYLRQRVTYGADGVARQDIVVGGQSAVPSYLEELAKADPASVPQNRDPKLFWYSLRHGGEPAAEYGAGVPLLDGKGGVGDFIFAPNGRHLVLLAGSALCTFEPGSRRYLDCVRLPAAFDVWRYEEPSQRFMLSPDNRVLFMGALPNAESANWYEVQVAPNGKLTVVPYAALAGLDATSKLSVPNAARAFVADPAGDGSYDLFLGQYWRRQNTSAWVLRDFIPPRP